MAGYSMKSLVHTLSLAFAGGAVVAGSVVAFAAEHSIGQKSKAFSESTIMIKKGDVVVFVNDDNVTHNVMTINSPSDFNIGLQPVGVSTPITFDKPGEYTILCAMHPRMKLIVKVDN
jgi:plastocyanin